MEAEETGNGGAVEAQEVADEAVASNSTAGAESGGSEAGTDAPAAPLATIEAGLVSLEGGRSDETEVAEETAPEEPPALSEAEAAAQLLVEELQKLPGVVPQVIRGSTVEEVRASLQLAREAYTQVREQVQGEAAVRVPPARSGAGPAPEPATPFAKIEAGLAQHQRGGSSNGYAADTDFRTGKVKK